MSAPLSRHHFAPVLPLGLGTLSLTHPSFDVAERRAAARRGRPGWLRRAFDAVTGRGRYAALNELASFSDRELADIGLTRSDIPRVFDPEFAAEFAARR